MREFTKEELNQILCTHLEPSTRLRKKGEISDKKQEEIFSKELKGLFRLIRSNKATESEKVKAVTIMSKLGWRRAEIECKINELEVEAENLMKKCD